MPETGYSVALGDHHGEGDRARGLTRVFSESTSREVKLIDSANADLDEHDDEAYLQVATGSHPDPS